MTNEEKAKWFDVGLKFALDGDIHIVLKSFKKGQKKWGIVNTKTKEVFNSNMEWEVEPPSSKRDEAFLIRTRFDFEQGVDLYNQYKMFAD
ncbi:MAG: hypothetical protein KKA84_13015 [Bacteroidetes bacterium]|nr:hypothetical protein [Bacteroidota bacterium]